MVQIKRNITKWAIVLTILWNIFINTEIGLKIMILTGVFSVLLLYLFKASKIIDESLIKMGAKEKIPVERALAEIDVMDENQFEGYMKHIFKNLGYSTRQISGFSNVLIITSNEGIKTAVIVKRDTYKVWDSAVKRVLYDIQNYKCTQGMVVTSGYFTDSAIQLARANNVNLVDRNELVKLLTQTPVYTSLQQAAIANEA